MTSRIQNTRVYQKISKLCQRHPKTVGRFFGWMVKSSDSQASSVSRKKEGTLSDRQSKGLQQRKTHWLKLKYRLKFNKHKEITRLETSMKIKTESFISMAISGDMKGLISVGSHLRQEAASLALYKGTENLMSDFAENIIRHLKEILGDESVNDYCRKQLFDSNSKLNRFEASVEQLMAEMVLQDDIKLDQYVMLSACHKIVLELARSLIDNKEDYLLWCRSERSCSTRMMNILRADLAKIS